MVLARPALSLIMSRAALRSDVPLASVNLASTISPWLFSIIIWPMWQSLASFPTPLRNSRASGSVVEACVSLARFSPWKSRSELRPPSLGGSSLPSFGTKLFILAQASISVPSTEKCSLACTHQQVQNPRHELGRDIASQQSVP